MRPTDAPLRTPAACALSCVLAALLLLAALPARPAAATKEYARKEQKDCSHCHISDKGAGPRNPTGREYEANGHRFGVESWSSTENRDAYLRAKAALAATWYGETARLLEDLAGRETLPGGTALIDATRAKYRMFPRVWLGNARKLLEKGERGRANAFGFLVKLESQFPASDEGREAVRMLDEFAAADATRDAVAEARAVEASRMRYVEARTEAELGATTRARALFAQVLADARAEPWHADARQLLSELPAE